MLTTGAAQGQIMFFMKFYRVNEKHALAPCPVLVDRGCQKFCLHEYRAVRLLRLPVFFVRRKKNYVFPDIPVVSGDLRKFFPGQRTELPAQGFGFLFKSI